MDLKDRKTKITFHSGVLTIGGTVIEIAYEDSHIFFDFGTEFKPELNLKNESLQELINHRLVPHLENVYDPELGYTYPFDKGPNYTHTAVFLSHCHLDHTRMVNYLDPKIPMYALKETKVLLKSLNAQNDFILPRAKTSDSFTRDIIGCDNHDVIEVGDIKVELSRVDHDAYGACGLLITTPDMHIAYTGDLRLHGFDVEDSLHYCEQAKNTDMLIIEGVSISFPQEDRATGRIETEADLLKKIVNIVNSNPTKQVTFNCYPANVKRLAEIVRQSPREVVLEASFANILKECLNMECKYYNTNDNNFNLDKNLEVDYNTLIEDEGDYLWQVVDHHENLKGGGVYIHSDASPLGEFDPAYLPFIQLLKDCDIEFNRIACSGHAYPEDLDRIVGLIQPKLLVPIHSLRPDLLENKYGMRHLPTRGETI